MLQALLIAVISAEIILYVWLAGAMSAHGFSWLAIAAMIFLIALLWRLSHATGSFIVSGLMRLWQGRHDVGLKRAFIGEFCARLTSFNIAQPLVQWVMPPEPMVKSNTTPVILVHGYFSNRGMWAQFVKRLDRAQISPVFTHTLTPPFGDIETFSLQLHERIEAICNATGQAEVIIIAHSMGGLVARQYMVTHGSARIAKLITLGSPHHGTRLAVVGVGKCSAQMRTNSMWLAALTEKEKPIVKPLTTSIYTINDDLAYPPESARLDWAENVEVNRVGHVGLLYSPAIATLVISELLAFMATQKKKT
jgi:triacylglycerol lipase